MNLPVRQAFFDVQSVGLSMKVAVGLVLCLLLGSVPVASAQSDSSEEKAWPGDPIDNHVHMTWAALTLEVNGVGR